MPKGCERDGGRERGGMEIKMRKKKTEEGAGYGYKSSKCAIGATLSQ